jgi:epoxide hydrolase-like predicted phosphatase
MHKPRWIIFDVGGVLLDWPSSSTAVAEYLGVTHDELFDVLFDQTVEMSIGAKMNVGEISAHDGWTMVLEKLKKEHTPQDVITRWLAEEYWLEDTLKLLQELHSAGYKLAIMSNSWLGLSDPVIRAVLPSELKFFDEIFDSSVERVEKPDVAFYELVEQRTGDSGKDLFFIDDFQKNLDIAEQRGWQQFLYNMGNDAGLKSNTKLRKTLL